MDDININSEIFKQPSPNIYMLITVSEDGVYGLSDNYQLPFLESGYDYSLFNILTKNQCVLVGRKTWCCFRSVPNLSEERKFLVLTKNSISLSNQHIMFLNTFEDAIKFWKMNLMTQNINLWICGGPSLFMSALNNPLTKHSIKNIYTIVIFKKYKNNKNKNAISSFNINMLEHIKWEMDGNFIAKENFIFFKWKRLET